MSEKFRWDRAWQTLLRSQNIAQEVLPVQTALRVAQHYDLGEFFPDLEGATDRSFIVSYHDHTNRVTLEFCRCCPGGIARHALATAMELALGAPCNVGTSDESWRLPVISIIDLQGALPRQQVRRVQLHCGAGLMQESAVLPVGQVLDLPYAMPELLELYFGTEPKAATVVQFVRSYQLEPLPSIWKACSSLCFEECWSDNGAPDKEVRRLAVESEELYYAQEVQS